MKGQALTAMPTDKALLLTRTYKASIHRVYQAWIDLADLTRWYTPNEAWPARVRDLDVREGGGFLAEFGSPGEPPWVERVQYRVIDPPHVLSMLGHMTHKGAHVALTRYEILLTDLGEMTELRLTETGAPPELLQERGGGWGGSLDNLGRLLAS